MGRMEGGWVDLFVLMAGPSHRSLHVEVDGAWTLFRGRNSCDKEGHKMKERWSELAFTQGNKGGREETWSGEGGGGQGWSMEVSSPGKKRGTGGGLEWRRKKGKGPSDGLAESVGRRDESGGEE